MTTIEIKERIVVPVARTDAPRLPCPICAGSTMVTPETAAAIARVTVRSIYARAEAESVHFLETQDGLLLLCANSLIHKEPFDEVRKLICATNPVAEPPAETISALPANNPSQPGRNKKFPKE
ncbi:MAG: hypothetical protein ABJB49_04410 [Nitrospirota bacterium]